MKQIGKALGTFALWGGICLSIYLLNSIEILTGGGAGLIIVGGFMATFFIWMEPSY